MARCVFEFHDQADYDDVMRALSTYDGDPARDPNAGADNPSLLAGICRAYMDGHRRNAASRCANCGGPLQKRTDGHVECDRCGTGMR